MFYFLIGVVLALCTFAYIFVFMKPEPKEITRYGSKETVTNHEGWIVRLVAFSLCALFVWPLFFLTLGAVWIAKKIKARIDAKAAA
ncbi:hypothetical protein BAJUN_00300 [Bajunvirus bajun]|uniref:Transmembrane protein n=1 Tax=Brevundimonas phage vB_BgoS-Bajun TaxID=2948594 RepID=A0A9E7SU07_9CAUD|nr:hypothetical protein BAJUN_00300 [Brevundimonas phage vB_BgoS-Bajun]